MWIAGKIGLSHQMDLAVESEETDAAWSHLDSTVFQLGQELTAVFMSRQRSRSADRRATSTPLVARRDSVQAALERLLGLMQTGLAVR